MAAGSGIRRPSGEGAAGTSLAQRIGCPCTRPELGQGGGRTSSGSRYAKDSWPTGATSVAYLFYQDLRYGIEMQDIIEPALDPVWLGVSKPAEVVGGICQQVNAKIAELKAGAPQS